MTFSLEALTKLSKKKLAVVKLICWTSLDIAHTNLSAISIFSFFFWIFAWFQALKTWASNLKPDRFFQKRTKSLIFYTNMSFFGDLHKKVPPSPFHLHLSAPVTALKRSCTAVPGTTADSSSQELPWFPVFSQSEVQTPEVGGQKSDISK